MGPIKIHNGGNYAHAQHLNAYNFSLRQNSAKLITKFIGQFLKGNIMGPIKFKMVEIMRMRNILMLITSVRVKIELNL